ncbi:MAG: serine/threonine-protein kinase [Burkholderiaceae bacterium]
MTATPSSRSASAADTAASLTFGPYRTLEKVGAGATATVYRAIHTGTGQMVALKVILFNQSNAKLSRRLKKLFATEASLAMKVKHPNIVSIFEADIEEKFAYIAMEFVPGVALREHCSFDKLLPPHRVVEIMFKCAMALDFSARMGVVHRDIKPDNIMLGADDVVKITDFGLALDMKKKSDADSTFIMGVGSPAYMSPEQIKDYPLNGQTDLYSLGTVMYELLTGRQPFRAKNRAALMYKIINMDAEPVSTLNPSVPDSLDPIIKRTLEKDLYTRYRTGAQFAQDLSSAKFQILDDADSVRLTRRFKVLRQNAAFTDFENDEIWEILRISHWRVIHESRPIMVEGDEGGNFGVIIDGEVEVSLKGRQLAVYGPAQVVGELAFLSPDKARRNATVVAMIDTIYLEVNAAAYALASEECQFHFKELVVGTLMRRTQEANEMLIANAPAARRSIRDDSEFSFGLVPIGDEARSADDSVPAAAPVYRTRTGAPANRSGFTAAQGAQHAAAPAAASEPASMTNILFTSDGGVRLVDETSPRFGGTDKQRAGRN